ncbi:hypothetical protein MMC28_001282 [Mycoblastus sanguinarius]|nr:hypothetical protein [Mycoblastus sanguinarius]
MFLIYCIGAGATGLALVGALIGVLVSGRMGAFVNFTLANLAFFSLLIASAIATGIINKVCNVVNQHGNDIGVYAYKGTTFIGMSWAATILILLAGCAWIFEFFKGRGDQVSYVMEGKEETY